MNRKRPLELSSPCMRGHDVKALQVALINRGYEIDHDGVFGPLTQWAVEKFQAAVDLPVSGIADTATQRIIFSRDLYLGDPYVMGSDVKAVQVLLARIGYDVTADGVFGLKTREAVLDFQAYYGLPENGIIGGATLSRLLYMPAMAEAS